MKAKTKTKSSVQETKSIYTEMKTSDMTDIDRKIHDLLIAEGYRVTGMKRFEGRELNNYTDVNRMEYQRGERERVFVCTNTPNVPQTNKIAGMLWEPVEPETLNEIAHSS
jgi:hypothetical protein